MEACLFLTIKPAAWPKPFSNLEIFLNVFRMLYSVKLQQFGSVRSKDVSEYSRVFLWYSSTHTPDCKCSCKAEQRGVCGGTDPCGGTMLPLVVACAQCMLQNQFLRVRQITVCLTLQTSSFSFYMWGYLSIWITLVCVAQLLRSSLQICLSAL